MILVLFLFNVWWNYPSLNQSITAECIKDQILNDINSKENMSVNVQTNNTVLPFLEDFYSCNQEHQQKALSEIMLRINEAEMQSTLRTILLLPPHINANDYVNAAALNTYDTCYIRSLFKHLITIFMTQDSFTIIHRNLNELKSILDHKLNIRLIDSINFIVTKNEHWNTEIQTDTILLIRVLANLCLDILIARHIAETDEKLCISQLSEEKIAHSDALDNTINFTKPDPSKSINPDANSATILKQPVTIVDPNGKGNLEPVKDCNKPLQKNQNPTKETRPTNQSNSSDILNIHDQQITKLQNTQNQKITSNEKISDESDLEKPIKPDIQTNKHVNKPEQTPASLESPLPQTPPKNPQIIAKWFIELCHHIVTWPLHTIRALVHTVSQWLINLFK